MNKNVASGQGPIHRLARYAGGRLELWLTPCIVTMPPPPKSHCLVVPSNERLVGTQFSHFPVGGPTPSAPHIGVPPPKSTATTGSNGNTSDTILYACETVDGTVTEYAGVEFERQVKALPLVGELSREDYPIRCPTGEARRIPSVGYLRHNFDSLILTVAPFYGHCHTRWHQDLTSAYMNAFQLAHGAVATPLLGAGARGAPVEEAAKVAATSILSFLASDQEQNVQNKDNNRFTTSSGSSSLVDVVRLCVLEEDVAEILHNNLEDST